jgi:hypothetical protein
MSWAIPAGGRSASAFMVSRDASRGGVTLADERGLHRLLPANLWHVHGRDPDPVFDSGLGAAEPVVT